MGVDPLQSYREASRVHQPHGWKKHVTRRRVIAGGVAAGGAVWTAPAVYAWTKPESPGSDMCDHHIKYLCVVLIWAKYEWARFGCLWDTEKKTWVLPTQDNAWNQPFCLKFSWGWTKCTSLLIWWLNQMCKVDRVGDGPDAQFQLTLASTSGLSMSEGWAHNGANTGGHCNPCVRYGTGWRFKPWIDVYDPCAPTTTVNHVTTTTSKATTTTSKATTTTSKYPTTTSKATTTTSKYPTTTSKATTTTSKYPTTTAKATTTTSKYPTTTAKKTTTTTKATTTTVKKATTTTRKYHY